MAVAATAAAMAVATAGLAEVAAGSEVAWGSEVAGAAAAGSVAAGTVVMLSGSVTSRAPAANPGEGAAIAKSHWIKIKNRKHPAMERVFGVLQMTRSTSLDYPRTRVGVPDFTGIEQRRQSWDIAEPWPRQ